MFTNTLLLWFLPLALVPIILHLLALFRIRTVELSTFRFLMDSYVQQRWRLRLVEYLLMFLRAAFVALIVLSFSRPVVEKLGFLSAAGTGRDVAILVDAGATMALRAGGRTSLERAQDAAKVIVDLLGPEDHVTVIRAGHRPEIMATGFAARTETIEASIAAIKPDAESSFSAIGETDLRHPVLSAFDDPQLDSFSTVRLYRYFPIEVGPIEVGAATTRMARVLMRLADQTPILVEAPMGAGKMLLAGFAATPRWSNLPLKPEYVPLLLRAVAYLRRRAPAEVPSAVRPHMPASLRLSETWSQARVETIDPDGESHPIELRYTEDSYTGTFLQTGGKGYYSFVVEPRAEAAPERVELAFAVNLETSREDFETLDEAKISALLAPVEPLYLSGSPDDPTLENQLTRRREIWRLLIWILFCVIGVEFFLATLRPSPVSQGREVSQL